MGRLTHSQAIGNVTRHWIENLPPSYFSLVMATGIVSIASDLLGMRLVAMILFFVNCVAFSVLWVMTILRILIYPKRLVSDLRVHALGPGYFTIVAAAGVLGVQVVRLTGEVDLAIGLWALAGGLWLLITYAFFTAIIVHSQKPTLKDGLSGVWLIASVATQSIAVLGTTIAGHVPEQQQSILFLSLCFYLMGCMLYINIIALVFYRLTFVLLEPASFTPPYWVNMGATAIATQAGASLLLHSDQSVALLGLLPFIKGFTLFFWASGTWWIPLLICLGVWTHGVRRVPVAYTPLFWGAVFPIGMYTASTYQLATALELEGLLVIPEATIYIALLAWVLTFFGLLRRIARGIGAVIRGVTAAHLA